MKLLRLVLMARLDGGGGNDWRFCLQVASILSEIAMKNATQGNYNNNNINNNIIKKNNNSDNSSSLAMDIPFHCFRVELKF